MPPHLANQNVDVPQSGADPFLSLWQRHGPPSFSLCHRSLSQASDLVISSCIYPSLVAQSPLRSLTQAYRVFTCNLKWAFEAQQVCVMPPSTLPPLIGQSSMTSSSEDCMNQVK